MSGYTVQTWKGHVRIHDDISGMSLDAAREIARVHAALGYIGRVWDDAPGADYTEVYTPDGGCRRGPFGETTIVRFSEAGK